MNRLGHIGWGGLAATLCGACLLGSAWTNVHAQDSPGVAPAVESPHNDHHTDLRRLYREVELGLHGIDELLGDAAAKKNATDVEPGADGVLERLQATLVAGRRVQRGFDELLELTRSSACSSPGT